MPETQPELQLAELLIALRATAPNPTLEWWKASAPAVASIVVLLVAILQLYVIGRRERRRDLRVAFARWGAAINRYTGAQVQWVRGKQELWSARYKEMWDKVQARLSSSELLAHARALETMAHAGRYLKVELKDLRDRLELPSYLRAVETPRAPSDKWPGDLYSSAHDEARALLAEVRKLVDRLG